MIYVRIFGSPYKTMRVNNFNKLHIIAFATFARKWDFSPAKTLCNKAGIILLDLNMPKMNGIEFLRIAQKDASLKKISVIFLTTSKEDQDKVDSFDLGVSGYMIKPVDYRKFVEVVKIIDLYWTLSELPD